MQIPLPLLIAATLILYGLLFYVLWEAFFGRRPEPAPPRSGDLQQRLDAALEQARDIEAAYREAYAGLETQPRDADPGAVFTAFRVHVADPSLLHDGETLTRRWHETDHPPFPAVLAGIILLELDRPRIDTQRTAAMIRLLLDEAPPAVVGYLVDGLEQRLHRLDAWLGRAGPDGIADSAIARMDARSPQVAARLRRLAQSVRNRHRELTATRAEALIARFEPFDMLDNGYATAAELVSVPVQSHPEVAARIDDMVARKSGHPDWRVLRLDMDLILIEGGRHPDTEKAIARMEAGLDDPDPDVADHAGDVAADLIRQDLLDHGFRVRMRAALDRARQRSTTLPEGLTRLQSALEDHA